MSAYQHGSSAMKAMMSLLAVAATVTTFGTAQAQPNPPGIKLDHYACYRLSPVKLADQFGESAAGVVREQFLCAPTSKNGGEVINKQDHLVCYVIQGGKNAG